jgi:hypothetical protein
MEIPIYKYSLDSDWEKGHCDSEIYSGKLFRKCNGLKERVASGLKLFFTWRIMEDNYE